MSLTSNQRGFCLGIGMVAALTCIVQLPLRELNASLYQFLAFMLGMTVVGYAVYYVWTSMLCDPIVPPRVVTVACPPQIIRETNTVPAPVSKFQQALQLFTFLLSITQTFQLSTIFEMLNTARTTWRFFTGKFVGSSLRYLEEQQLTSRRRRNKKRKTTPASAPAVPVSASACPPGERKDNAEVVRKDNAEVVAADTKVNN